MQKLHRNGLQSHNKVKISTTSKVHRYNSDETVGGVHLNRTIAGVNISLCCTHKLCMYRY